MRTTPQQSALRVVAVLILLGAGYDEIRIHVHGHRVLGRIASVGHSRGGSSTRLTYTTLAGEPEECTVSGDRGRVGGPLWLRYLPDEPALCSSDDTVGFRRPIFLALLGAIALGISASFWGRGRDENAPRS